MGSRRNDARDTPDRALRALAREEPERIAALLRALAPGLLPAGARMTPAHVDDPHLDAVPSPIDADFAARLVGLWILVHVEFQGYRDGRFLKRLFRYHLRLVDRYPDYFVISVAVWLIRPPESQRANEITVNNVNVSVTSLVLPEASAARLLEDPRTACFAVVADPGAWSMEELCRRVVEVMRQGGASWHAWRVAGVLATIQGRYSELRRAMQQEQARRALDELDVYLENLGYRRGRRHGRRAGLEQGLQQGLEQGLQQGRREGVVRGVAQGMQRALLATYQARFGAVPRGIKAAIEEVKSARRLLQWQEIVSTRSAEEIARALLPSEQRARRSGRGGARCR